MSRRIRLAAWVVAITGAIACESCGGSAAWWGVSFLATLLLLLSTTPFDAIRLPTSVSVYLIIAVTIALQLEAVHRGLNSRTTALTVIVLAFVFSKWMRRVRASPWWAAPLVWGPWAYLGWEGASSIALIVVVAFGAMLVRSRP